MAGPVSIVASDQSTITAVIFGATLSVAAFTTGNSGTLAIGAAIARNRIDNRISAYLEKVVLTTQGGAVT